MEQNSPLLLLFLRPLNGAGIIYMVTGSAAAMVYGEPRMTYDVDIVIEMHLRESSIAAQLFPAGEFYVPPPEILEEAFKGTGLGHFNVIHLTTGFKADFYISRGEALHRWGLDHREKVMVEGEPVWLAPPEYVIIRKLQYFREGGSEKHIRDIKNMLRISTDRINRAILQRLAEENDVGEIMFAQLGDNL